jgi:hypothetical protein
MLRNIINSLLTAGGSPFESYYQRLLETSPETAPSAQEARSDFLRYTKRYQEF